MRRPILALTFAAALFAPRLFAQEPEPKITAQTPACPSTATLDLLIKAIDAGVTGPADKDRTCFRALFLSDARLIPIRIAKDGTATPVVLGVEDWVNAVKKRGSTVPDRETAQGQDGVLGSPRTPLEHLRDQDRRYRSGPRHQ